MQSTLVDDCGVELCFSFLLRTTSMPRHPKCEGAAQSFEAPLIVTQPTDSAFRCLPPLPRTPVPGADILFFKSHQSSPSHLHQRRPPSQPKTPHSPPIIHIPVRSSLDTVPFVVTMMMVQSFSLSLTLSTPLPPRQTRPIPTALAEQTPPPPPGFSKEGTSSRLHPLEAGGRVKDESAEDEGGK